MKQVFLFFQPIAVGEQDLTLFSKHIPNSLQVHLKHHGQDTKQKERKGTEEGRSQRKKQEACRVLLVVHLQGAQAGPPRYGYLQKGHVYHELIYQ